VRNGTSTFYVDGSPVGTFSATGFANADIVNASRDLLIGSWVNYWNMKGQVDKVKIYTRALSAAEILTAQ
jgi:hypothetical protein